MIKRMLINAREPGELRVALVEGGRLEAFFVETAAREVYCGAVGWVDADARTASLGVAIRTFWVRDGHVRFGTGAGITWSSDPLGEWRETELKADRLISIAAQCWEGSMSR